MVISTLVNRIFARYVLNLKKERALNLVGAIKELVALVSSNLFVSMPYLVSFLQQASDCLIARDVREAFQFIERPESRFADRHVLRDQRRLRQYQTHDSGSSAARH